MAAIALSVETSDMPRLRTQVADNVCAAAPRLLVTETRDHASVSSHLGFLAQTPSFLASGLQGEPRRLASYIAYERILIIKSAHFRTTYNGASRDWKATSRG